MIARRVAQGVLVGWLLVGCQQDPFQIPTFGDGGARDLEADLYSPTDGKVADAQVVPDTVPAVDLSYDACIQQIEVCNSVDDNCNQQVDEGFDKQGDARYCENCKGCQQLLSKNAIPGCQAGKCTVKSCVGGYNDLNKDPSDGCEYKCTVTGVEVCDGIDNDCDGQVDEGVSLSQQICKTLGACTGASASCKGAQGWVCQYGADVELQPCTIDADCGTGNTCDVQKGVCPNLVIINEALCDGKDGDCDGLPDDPWANPALPNALGKPCDPNPPKTCQTNNDCDPAKGSTCVSKQCSAKKGVCQDVGKYVCNSAKTGVSCALQTAGKAPSAELCNAIDDDCNGQVDDKVTDEELIDIGTIKIFKYEASRPDATSAGAGIASNGRACSRPSRHPWANVTRGEAQAACQRAGARLCTVAEWVKACRGPNNYIFPYGNTFNPTGCNGRAFSPAVDAISLTHLPAQCNTNWSAAGLLYNMSGNVKEWTVTQYAGANPVDHELRGGAYDTPSLQDAGAGLSCIYQLPAPPSALSLPTLGFRCCKN